MEIKNASYLISNADYRKCPDDNVIEFAFIGRSNVGKSSLINMLTGNSRLAKTSQKPGKTQLINHFNINDGHWRIVDLPGYGYAARGMEQRREFRMMIENYILNRPQLALLFVLLDIRHKPQKIDLEFINWLGGHGVPFALIFTKADKISATACRKNVEVYKKTLLESWEELPSIFISSSEKRAGRDEILDFIGSIINTVQDEQTGKQE